MVSFWEIIVNTDSRRSIVYYDLYGDEVNLYYADRIRKELKDDYGVPGPENDIIDKLW